MSLSETQRQIDKNIEYYLHIMGRQKKKRVNVAKVKPEEGCLLYLERLTKNRSERLLLLISETIEVQVWMKSYLALDKLCWLWHKTKRIDEQTKEWRNEWSLKRRNICSANVQSIYLPFTGQNAWKDVLNKEQRIFFAPILTRPIMRHSTQKQRR